MPRPSCVVTIGQSFSDPAWDVNCATHGRLATQVGRIEAAEVAAKHHSNREADDFASRQDAEWADYKRRNPGPPRRITPRHVDELRPNG